MERSFKDQERSLKVTLKTLTYFQMTLRNKDNNEKSVNSINPICHGPLGRDRFMGGHKVAGFVKRILYFSPRCF